VKAERWFVLVGGINGAGKTTLAQSRSFLQIFGVDLGSGRSRDGPFQRLEPGRAPAVDGVEEG
jgi:ABC-type cobalamin/Fe3+-siderophores transport system ATPase subunit